MKKIAVIGAGTMGNGIAHVFAQSGYDVSLIDISESALNKALSIIQKNLDRLIKKERITEDDKNATVSRIKIHTGIKSGVKDADLIVEAATENEDLKLKIFKEIDEAAKPEAILATNTSSISITKIAAVTKRPEKVIGMHFMNPVPIMKLVEIIKGYKTSNDVMQTIMETAKTLGKVPVEVNDFPGFVANRILIPMINEAIITLNRGVAGVAEIDTVMKLGMAHPMGPLQLADFIGLDVCLAITEVLYKGLGEAKYAASPLLKTMVDAGNLGVKSGEGFYSWGHGTKELIVADRFKK
ncbi:MAG: 3-hydroxybutyryl-CoA dehydrogenase [Bacteroidales bacterium]|nr:3-hydroxybutyryl-CoA dehydrogenase [Bacteroidales bacterium]